MPIVAGNDQQPEKKSSGAGCGWVVMLLVFLWRPLYTMIRDFTNGRFSDDQLVMIVGGIFGLIVLAALVQRVNRMRASNTAGWPTPYTPPSPLSSNPRQLRSPGEQYLPAGPRFEPIITGKVILAGLILALLLGGIGVLLLWMT